MIRIKMKVGRSGIDKEHKSLRPSFRKIKLYKITYSQSIVFHWPTSTEQGTTNDDSTKYHTEEKCQPGAQLYRTLT